MSEAVSVAQNQRGEIRETDVTPALSAGGGTVGEGYPAARTGEVVRRLTPTERERLMGAPDGWTYDTGPSLVDAPNTYPAEDRCVVDLLPDGRRESAAGDGVAVPCAEWIGRRILALDERLWPYVWCWRAKHPERKGQRCRVWARGTMNSIGVEFPDGFRTVTARYAIRRAA